MKGLTTNFLLLLQVTLTVAQTPNGCPPDYLTISQLAKYASIIAKVRVVKVIDPVFTFQPAQVEMLCVIKGESLSPKINVTIIQDQCMDGSVFVDKNNTYILLLQNDYTKPAIAISADDESQARKILNLTSEECVSQSKSQSGCGQISDKQPRPALQGYAIIRHGEKALCSAALITGDWLIASAHCVRKHDSKQLTADIGSKRVDIKLIKIKKNRNLALLRLRPGLSNPDTMKLPIADDGAIASSTSCVAIGQNQRSRTVTSTRPHSTRRLTLFCSETCGAAPAEEAIIVCYDGNAWVMRGVQSTGDDSCDDGGSSFTRLAYSKTLKWIKKVMKIGAKD